MTRALKIPNALIMPPATTARRSQSPAIKPAASAQEPFSKVEAGSHVIETASTGRRELSETMITEKMIALG